ncbi:MAG: hypothetical protein MUC59_12865 [Saprospiraceae bacterium]|nr:hypothetical protein [Saprospiraceae bacterium]
MVKNTLPARPVGKTTKAKQRQQITTRLLEFSGLEANWDGDGADAVTEETLELAKRVAFSLIDADVNIDFCVPMRSGGVQFEFKLGGDCEMEVQPNGDIFFLSYDDAANLLSKEKLSLEQIKKHVGYPL